MIPTISQNRNNIVGTTYKLIHIDNALSDSMGFTNTGDVIITKRNNIRDEGNYITDHKNNILGEHDI